MSTSTFGSTVEETVVPLTAEHPVARVDLLPHEARRFGRARLVMALSVVVTAAACGGVWLLASNDAADAREALQAEQARTVTLQAEAAQYAAVPAMIASVDRAKGALELAMASDIEYYRYLSQFASVAPEGVWFTDLSFSAVPAGQVSSDPLAPQDAVADVSLSGSALAYVDVASLLDSLDGVTSVEHSLFTDATYNDDEAKEEPFVDFQANAKLTPDAYSGRYSRTGE
jgi:Tfp pilus assembly protein PilN